jgi:hypothetical protein
MRIYNEYVSLHAPFTVNLAGENKLAIERKLGVVGRDKKGNVKYELNLDNIAQELSFHDQSRTESDHAEQNVEEDGLNADIFNIAQAEIHNLMFKDSFRRFMHTEEYINYCVKRTRKTQESGFVATIKGTMKKFMNENQEM